LIFCNEEAHLYELIGLLESPDEMSCGMIPIVVRDSDNPVPFVCGLSKASRHRVFRSAEEAEHLLRVQCIRTDALGITFDKRPDSLLLALWLGRAFEEGCRTENIPFPEPTDPSHQMEKGRIWILPSKDAYAPMDAWTKTAVLVALKTRSAKIARLMCWCMPHREETQAAEWYTETDPEKRRRALKWMKAAYYRKMTPFQIEQKLECVTCRILAADT